MRIPDHGCCHRCGHSCVGGVVEAGHAAKEAEHAAASRLLVEAQATRRGSGRHSKSSFLHCMEVRWQKLTSLVESSMRRPSASSPLTFSFLSICTPCIPATPRGGSSGIRRLPARPMPPEPQMSTQLHAISGGGAHKKKTVSLSRCGYLYAKL